MSGSASLYNHEIIQDVHDTAAHSLRTTLTNAEVDINVSAFTDSIKIGDGAGNTATITVQGPKKSLDVVVNDITISHTDDSIRLGNGTDLTTLSTVGDKKGLDVNVINSGTTTLVPSGETRLYYGTVSNLAIGGSSNVISYTTPAGNAKYIQKIYFSGTQVGTATVYKNSSPLIKVRLSPAVFTQIMDLATGSAFGTQLLPTDTVVVEVDNNGSSLADFDVSLQLMET